MAFDVNAAMALANGPAKPSLGDPDAQQQRQNAVAQASMQHARDIIAGNARNPYQEAPTPLQRFGRGMADVWEGGKTLADRTISHLPGTDTDEWQGAADRNVAQNLDAEQVYQQGRGPDAGIDWWRIGGDVAGTLPLAVGGGGAGLVGAAVRGAATGALQGGVIGAGRGEGLEGAALGAITGGPLGVVGQKIGQAIGGAISSRLAARAAAGLSPSEQQALTQIQQALADRGIDPGHAPALLNEARQMLQARGTVDAEALARKANLEDLGLEPTNAQVSRDVGDWQAERDLAEQPEGRGLKDRYTAQQQKLKDLLGQFRDQFGGAAGDMREAGDSVIQALKAKYGELQGAVSNLYRAAAERPGMDVTGVVRPTAVRSALEDARPYLDAGLAPRAQAAESVLGKLLEGEGEGQGLSLNGAELLRRRIGQLATDSTDKTERGVLNSLRTALDDDVFNAVGSDEFATAREAARQRFAEFEKGPLQAAVEKGIEPDKFLQKYVLGGDVAGIRALKNSLTEGNPLQQTRGGQAWSDLQQQVADWILQKATNGHPDNPVSQAALTRTLNQIGPARLREIFGTEELAGLRRLETAARDLSVKPQFATVNPSGTAYTAMRMLRGSIGHELLSRIPGIKTITAIRDAQAASGEAQNALRGGALTAGDREAVAAAQAARAASAGTAGARAAGGLLTPAAVEAAGEPQ